MVIPAHRPNIKYVHPLLQSLTNQTRRPDEVVVVTNWDEGDHTVQLQQWAAATAGWTKLVVVQCTGYDPPGRNRNRGAVAASGDILVFWDADDIPHPQKLAMTMALFTEYPNTAMLLHSFFRSSQRSASFTALSNHLSQHKWALHNNTWLFENERKPPHSPCFVVELQIHHGWASVRRSVALALPYVEFTAEGKPIGKGEDCFFDRRVANEHPVLFLNVVLGLYYVRSIQERIEYAVMPPPTPSSSTAAFLRSKL